MTALRILILTCDGTTHGEVCDTEHGGDPDFIGSFDLLREQAKAVGWAHQDGRDLCAHHAGGAQ